MRSFRIRVGTATYVVEVDDREYSPLAVRVNGRPYRVEVEWQGASSEATVAPEVVPSSPEGEPVPPPTSRPALPPTPRLSPAEREEARSVDAPMPGTIVDIPVRAGDRVDRGQEICVLEAMKMRNSIKSPRDGEIGEVLVSLNQKVAFGEPLIRFAAQ